jgi:hypothetical protein
VQNRRESAYNLRFGCPHADPSAHGSLLCLEQISWASSIVIPKKEFEVERVWIGVPFGGVNLSGMGGGTSSAQTFYDYLRDLAVARPYRRCQSRGENRGFSREYRQFCSEPVPFLRLPS